jgi:hypothetical protein
MVFSPEGPRFSGVFGNKKDSPGCSSSGINAKTAMAVARLQVKLVNNALDGSAVSQLYRISGTRVSEFSVRTRKRRASIRTEPRILRLCGGSWHVKDMKFDWKALCSSHRETASSISPAHITLGECTFFKDGRILVRKKEKKEVIKSIRAWL